MTSTEMDADDWLAVCPASEVEEDEPVRAELDGFPPLAVFELDGEYFVIDDTCSHGNASLADGLQEGDQIECPWHAGKFCIRNGQATEFPATEPVTSYPVQVIEGTIHVRREH